MFAAARVCCQRLPSTFVSAARKPIALKEPTNQLTCLVRGMNTSQSSRASTLRRAKGASIKERMMAPAGDGGMRSAVLKSSNITIYFETNGDMASITEVI